MDMSQAPSGNPAGPAGPSKIQHARPGLGTPIGGGAAGGGVGGGRATMEPAIRPVAKLDPGVPVAEPTGPGGASRITQFGGGAAARRHEDNWSRTPNSTGAGAIHCKTFHCKLTEDALSYMDQAINEWLDAHPQYEVKFVTSTIGTFTGKLKEPALICQVWV